MRNVLSMSILIAACAGLAVSCSTWRSSPSKLVDDPIAAIKGILPEGWVIQEVVENTHPFYRPEGKGKAVFVGSPREQGNDAKTQFAAVVYFMPRNYRDGGKDPTHGTAQTWPPRIIATTDSAKVYLWDGVMGEGEFKDSILKAILYR